MTVGALFDEYSFYFQGRFYEQTEGAAIDSPLSPIIADLYMEAFEKKSINTSPNPHLCGEDLLVILLLSSRRHRKTASSVTSTPQMRRSNLLWKTAEMMGPYLFWTSWSHHVQKAV